MASKTGYDQRVLTLFDGYVHGKLTRREFLDRAAAFTTAGASAAALFAALAPDYSRAAQVSPDDPSISTSYKKYGSPRGAGGPLVLFGHGEVARRAGRVVAVEHPKLPRRGGGARRGRRASRERGKSARTSPAPKDHGAGLVTSPRFRTRTGWGPSRP